MKIIQLTIDIVVDVKPEDLNFSDHDMCDGIEVTLPVVFDDEGDQRFRINRISNFNAKEV